MTCRILHCLAVGLGILALVPAHAASAEPAQTTDTAAPLARAARLVELGDGANAVELCESLLRQDPDNVPVRTFLARYYLTHPKMERDIGSMTIDFRGGSVSNNSLSIDSATATPKYTDVDVNRNSGRVHIRALSRLGQPGYDALCALLKDPAPEVRGAAVRGIAMSANPARVGTLIAAVDAEPDTGNVNDIVKALGNTGSADAFRFLYKRFAALPAKNRAPATGPAEAALLAALETLPNPEPADELAKQAMTGEPGLRRVAVTGLLNKADSDGTATMLALLFGKDEVPGDTWGIAQLRIRTLAPNHRRMVVEALGSPDKAVADRALAIAEAMRGDPSMSDALLRLLDPYDEQRATTILKLLSPPPTEEAVRRLSVLALDPATPKDVGFMASDALSETTESLRGAFLAELQKTQPRTYDDWRLIVDRTTRVTTKWNDPATAKVLFGLVNRLMDTDPAIARGFERANDAWILGPEEQDTVFTWLKDAPPQMPRFESARNLAYSFSRSGTTGTLETRARALRLLDNADMRRRKAAIGLLQASMMRDELTSGERAALNAQFDKALADYQKMDPTAEGSGANEAAQELQQLGGLIGRKVPPRRPRPVAPPSGAPQVTAPQAAPAEAVQRSPEALSREERIRQHQEKIQKIIDERRKGAKRDSPEAAPNSD